MRYLIDPDFESVPPGRFNWSSFLTTVVLFGLEHHLLLAGMSAEAMYSLVLYKSRRLSQCVLAHATTNLALAIYVLLSGEGQFWEPNRFLMVSLCGFFRGTYMSPAKENRAGSRKVAACRVGK